MSFILGSKAFTLSLVENAIKVSNGKVNAATLLKIQQLGRSLLRIPSTPLDGVEDALKAIKQMERYKMVVFTKGEILDQ